VTVEMRGEALTACHKGEQHCAERPDRASRMPTSATTGRSGRSAAKQERSVSGPGRSASEAGSRSDAVATDFSP
jgi:hypothetical protein